MNRVTANVSVRDTQLERLVDSLRMASNEYIEMMAAAYLKETNIPANEVELVQQIDGYKIRWYFQKRACPDLDKER